MMARAFGLLLLHIVGFQPRSLAAATLLPGVTRSASNESSIDHMLNDTFSAFESAGPSSADSPHGSGGVGWSDDSFDSFPPSRPFINFAQADSRLFDDAMDQVAALLQFVHEPLNLWNVATTLSSSAADESA